MTSLSNARGVEELRAARTAAADRFARQMRLLGQLEATARDLAAVTGRWHSQLAALAKLSGSAQAAAELTGVTKTDIDNAATKIARSSQRINNYIFITTDRIDEDAKEYYFCP